MKTIITKTTLVFSLLSTFAIGLSSCNNKNEIKYLDHSDYGTTLKSNVCTTVMYDNANYYYDICNNLKVKSQFSTFDPFDTSLFIRYSADRLSTQDIVNIVSILTISWVDNLSAEYLLKISLILKLYLVNRF